MQQRILEAKTGDFEPLALEVFRFQARHNPVYAEFIRLLGRAPERVETLESIPFLPIQSFKKYAIKTGQWPDGLVFTSSGTTGQTPSRHHVRDPQWYERLAVNAFERLYGPLREWVVLGLLPSYLERSGSSLIFMVQRFMERSGHPLNGFYLHDYERLQRTLQHELAGRERVLLLGVSFALLDFAEKHPMPLPGVTLMETGGMKGRRRELTRPELHAILKRAFQLQAVHSEYGMTELLSQAYAPAEGRFLPAPTMRVLVREINDPFAYRPPGRTGVLHIIDLGNLDSCAFIATEDLGIRHPDGSFQVLGRLDGSDLRGCNLMVEGLG